MNRGKVRNVWIDGMKAERTSGCDLEGWLNACFHALRRGKKWLWMEWGEVKWSVWTCVPANGKTTRQQPHAKKSLANPLSMSISPAISPCQCQWQPIIASLLARSVSLFDDSFNATRRPDFPFPSPRNHLAYRPNYKQSKKLLFSRWKG